ncbi:hypothetical protein TcWFU_008442 [Taenia crassiceps]|uniref:Uncharacterized protein n=1 Tax=Taenia crassiceps TaxID=6207 RepID=A0ABR4QT05_9CEST
MDFASTSSKTPHLPQLTRHLINLMTFIRVGYHATFDPELKFTRKGESTSNTPLEQRDNVNLAVHKPRGVQQQNAGDPRSLRVNPSSMSRSSMCTERPALRSTVGWYDLQPTTEEGALPPERPNVAYSWRSLYEEVRSDALPPRLVAHAAQMESWFISVLAARATQQSHLTRASVFRQTEHNHTPFADPSVASEWEYFTS